MRLFKTISLLLLSSIASLFFIGCSQNAADGKPVIYLYPTEEEIINVKLDYDGELTSTYPTYNDGWTVKAKPDGTLTNLEDNREYSYLFWEGNPNVDLNISEGFLVKAEDTKDFLQEKLEYLGLTPKEYNEFIVYWLPILQQNEYNLISFAGEEYSNYAKLEITPKPDSILRVMMIYKALDKPVEIKEQQLKQFERTGFSVIEWGGRQVY